MARQCLVSAIAQLSVDPVVVEEEQIPQQLKGPEVGLRTKSHGMVSDEQERVVIGQDKERYFQVGSQLPSSEKVAFVKFLEDNNDVFAWSTYDVPEIDPEFICQ